MDKNALLREIVALERESFRGRNVPVDVLRGTIERHCLAAQPESTQPTPRQVPIHMTETALDFDSEIEYIKELNAKAGPAQEAEKGQGK